MRGRCSPRAAPRRRRPGPARSCRGDRRAGVDPPAGEELAGRHRPPSFGLKLENAQDRPSPRDDVRSSPSRARRSCPAARSVPLAPSTSGRGGQDARRRRGGSDQRPGLQAAHHVVDRAAGCGPVDRTFGLRDLRWRRWRATRPAASRRRGPPPAPRRVEQQLRAELARASRSISTLVSSGPNRPRGHGEHRPRIQLLDDPHDRDAGLGVAGDDRAVHRRRAALARQHRGVHVDHAEPRDRAAAPPAGSARRPRRRRGPAPDRGSLRGTSRRGSCAGCRTGMPCATRDALCRRRLHMMSAALRPVRLRRRRRRRGGGSRAGASSDGTANPACRRRRCAAPDGVTTCPARFSF